jgi:predicted nucleic acid-binding protein
MKNTLFILAIFCSFLTFAQTTRSIEVKVKDTVELKVTSADVQITVSQDYNDYENEYYEGEYDGYEGYDDSEYNYDYESDYYNHMTRKEKRQEKKNNKKFEKEMKKLEEEMARFEQSLTPVVEEVTYDSTEIDYPIETYESYYMTYAERKAKWITFLTENNIAFDTTVVGTNEYSDYGSFNIQVNNLSIEKLDLIYQFTDSVENSYPSVTATHYESLEPKMAEVYSDLYKKAQTEANSLAKVLGATPVKVIRVYEPVIDISNFGESYIDMVNNLLKKGGENLKPESKKTYVERIFVFEIK